MLLRVTTFVLLAGTLPGFGQSAPKKREIFSISAPSMRAMIEELGFRVKEKAVGEITALDFSLNGHAVTVIAEPKDLHLSSCFASDIPPIKENQWNREHFSTRAQLDESGCVSLHSDLQIGGVATKELVEQFLRGFLTSVTVFDRFAGAAPSEAGQRPKSPIAAMGWSQAGQSTKGELAVEKTDGSSAGLVKIGPHLSLRYDTAQWEETVAGDGAGLALKHNSGQLHAVLIAEQAAVPIGSVADVALENAQSADEEAKIVFQQQRRINGVDVRFLKIEASVDGIPTAYWGLFYGGEYGTVQVVASVAQARLPEFQKEMTDLMDGFSVSK